MIKLARAVTKFVDDCVYDVEDADIHVLTTMRSAAIFAIVPFLLSALFVGTQHPVSQTVGLIGFSAWVAFTAFCLWRVSVVRRNGTKNNV